MIRIEEKVILIKIKEIIAICKDGVDIETISNDTNLIQDLAYNSLEYIQLIVLIEEAFKISLDDEYLIFDNLPTVNKIVMVVKEMISV